MAEEQRPDKPGKKNDRSSGGDGGMKFGRGLFGWILFVGLAFMVFMLLNRGQDTAEEVYLSDFLRLLEADKVRTLTIVGDEIRGEFTEPQTPQNIMNFVTAVPAGTAADWQFTQYINERRQNAEVRVENRQNLLINILLPLIPWILIFAFIWFFIFRQLHNAGGGAGMLGNFGRSKHKITSKEHTNITFNDVAGVEEAKEEVMEIVEFLKNPKKFQRLGGRIPRGVLLVGEPGTGKTLLAKAIAGEADVPFFSISGSDFVEMFVGVGASRVRDLFKQAKDNSPCIIFLDEIDAVGRKRGSGFVTGGNDEREQTLNAILVEMDGFDTTDQVIVIAATNRDDVLDPALTRPGRFDRQVTVPLPDLKGRMEILKVHARKVKMSPTIDLERLARGTPMFSGADLAAIINEAAIIATMSGKDFVEQDDLEEARDKIKFGRARKSRVIEEKEKVATAFHEAGHAVIQSLLSDADPLHKVTIIPRGQFGGATFSLPEKDRYGFGLKYLHATMRVMCAGRIAEQIATGDVSSGAAQDIAQVTTVARMMVLEWGMSDRLGFVRYGDDGGGEFGPFGSRGYSDETARIIDEEIKRLADEAYQDAVRMCQEHWDKIDAVANALLKHETLTADEVHRLMRGDTLEKPSVRELLERERRKRRAAGEKALEQKVTPPQEPDEDERGVVPRPA
jgi:cell division protease FtsH